MKPKFIEYSKRQLSKYPFAIKSNENNYVYIEQDYRKHKLINIIVGMAIGSSIIYYSWPYFNSVLIVLLIDIVYACFHVMLFAPIITYYISEFDLVQIDQIDSDIIRSLRIKKREK